MVAPPGQTPRTVTGAASLRLAGWGGSHDHSRAQVAGTEQADMIAPAWSQRLEPGRALLVRRAVLDAVVPVLLVPMAAN